MMSEERWLGRPQWSLLRWIAPKQRLSVRPGQIDSRPPPVNYVWVSLGDTLELLGGISWGGREFFRPTSAEFSSLTHPTAWGQVPHWGI